MNKIKGKQVAVGRIVYKEGKPVLQHGEIQYLVGPLELNQHGLKDESFENCLKELEALGDFKAVSNQLNNGQGNEVAHPGLVLRSSKDPRLTCVVDIGSNWQKDSDAQHLDAPECDLVLKFFLDVFGEEGKDQVPEYPFPEDLVNYIDNLRKEEAVQPVMRVLTETTVKIFSNKDVDSLSSLFEDKVLKETGEADQDYDQDFYDAICKSIKKLGYDCKHKEFDKYQGVYFTVSKDGKVVAKLWTTDSYVVGKVKNKPKYARATLVGPQGDVYSATRGDYDFSLGKDHVFDDHELLLVMQDGTSKTISDPKVKDLPDLKDVGFGEYVGEPDSVLVVEPEGKQGEQAHIRVSADGKKVDLDKLPAILKKLSKEKTKEMAMEHTLQGVEDVDFFGLPKLEEEKDLAAKLDGQEEPNKAGEAIAKPASELKGDNKEVTETDLDAKKVKVGEPGDDHGDHVEGDSKQSDDQQKDVASAKVKVGKPGDDHGKHVAESKVDHTKRRLAEGKAHREAVRTRIEEARKRALKRFEEQTKAAEKAISESVVEDAEKVADLTKEAQDMGATDHELAKMKEAYEAKMNEAEDLKKLMQAKEKEMADMKAKKETVEKEGVKAEGEAAEAPKAEAPKVEAKAMPAAIRAKLKELMKKKHAKAS